jgi:hypothetical protein
MIGSPDKFKDYMFLQKGDISNELTPFYVTFLQ